MDILLKDIQQKLVSFEKKTKCNEAPIEIVKNKITENEISAIPKLLVKRRKPFNKLSKKEVKTLSMPVWLEDSKITKKKMKIVVFYTDEEGIQRRKTIYFGRPDKTFYVNHKDDSKRIHDLSRTRKCLSFFDQNFYEAHILNGPNTTIKDNYLRVLKMLI